MYIVKSVCVCTCVCSCVIYESKYMAIINLHDWIDGLQICFWFTVILDDNNAITGSSSSSSSLEILHIVIAVITICVVVSIVIIAILVYRRWRKKHLKNINCERYVTSIHLVKGCMCICIVTSNSLHNCTSCIIMWDKCS